MPRPQKQTVEYFPHYCNHKTTIYILEQKYGNDGYAFWFKLLEILGKEEGHFLDLKNPMKEEFLQAKTRLNHETVYNILDILAKLEAIDNELWKIKVVWSDNFVRGLKPVYANRRVEIPSRPIFLHVEIPPPPNNLHEEIPKGSKVKEVKKRTLCVYSENFESFWQQYPKHASKKGAFTEWKRVKATGLLPSIEVILSAVENQKRARAQAAQTGKFYPEWPDPERWLKKNRWEDDAESLIGKHGGGNNGNSHPYPGGKDFRTQQQREIDAETERINAEYYRNHPEERPAG